MSLQSDVNSTPSESSDASRYEVPLGAPPPADRSELVPRLYVAIGVIIVLLLAALAIWGTLLLASNYAIEVSVIRDLFIIALALESCIFGVIIMIMLIMMIRLVNTVEFEIKPLLQRTNDTVGLIRGTTQFVADSVVEPTIKARSYVAGVRQGVKVLFGQPKDDL
ncbi:MAG: hypothetical protein M9928_10180 [Anaerolineae bacterium]|nr:hypothetical protein [Anaerolineae bacterium]MCO5205389.1 hypothetical protein [Anaerolineae bacterium]